jgi:D-glycero-alpha-D-manno-heptose-7-phosphate kinase
MIITKTPLRISFCGGGTDLAAFYEREEGVVLSSAISLYVYLVIHPFFENRFMLKYSQAECVDTIHEVQHPLIRECLAVTKSRPPMEIASFADLPSKGSGLGSSSAFAVGLLKGLYSYQGLNVSCETCARQACEIEIGKLVEPIGKQDQYACAYGGINVIRFKADGDVHVEPVVIGREQRKAIADSLLLFYTGITRKASEILQEQKQRTMAQSETFDVLRRMRDQALELAEDLAKGDHPKLGKHLHQGWQLKQSLASKVSNPNLDAIYGRAMNAGAEGGKLLGAGGGGFFLFYCNPSNHARLCESLSDLMRVPFNLDSQGTRIIFSDDNTFAWRQ